MKEVITAARNFASVSRKLRKRMSELAAAKAGIDATKRDFEVAQSTFLREMENADLKHAHNAGWEQRITAFYATLLQEMEDNIVRT